MEEDNREEGPATATVAGCAAAAATTPENPRGDKVATAVVPETGSPSLAASPAAPQEEARDSACSSSSSSSSSSAVGRDAPNIPNVVEYHLKVTPPHQQSRRKPAGITDTATATAVSKTFFFFIFV